MDDGFFSSSLVRAVKAPRPGMPQCGLCGLMKTCKTPKMKVSGQGRRGILIVGEAPGKEEDERGVQFVGKTGQRLELELAKHGVNMRRDCWLHNAVSCRPPNNKLDTQPKAVTYCNPLVMRAIEELQPTTILLVGDHAVKSVVGAVWKEDPGGIGRWVGWRIPCQKPNAWICPVWHPSYVEREQSTLVDMLFAQHLGAAVRLSGRPWPDGPPDYPRAVDVVLDAETAAARVRKYKAGLVAVDFENDRLKPDHPDAAFVSCAVCWEGQETIAFPWRGPVRKAVCELFENPDLGKIASNMKHEDRWHNRKLGVQVQNWAFDTMLAAHCLDSRTGVTSLKFQAFALLGSPDYDSHVKPFLEAKGGNTPNRIRECDLRQLLVYNGLDALLEYEVAKVQAKKLRIDL